MGIITDVDQYSLYGEEAVAYGTEAAAIAFKWGLIQDIRQTAANNLKYHYGIGAGRAPQQTTAGLFNAGAGLDFELQTAKFMEYVLGSVSGTGTSGDPFIYAVADVLPSITIEIGQNLSTDEIYKYLGSLCDRCLISCSLNETVIVSTDFVSKTMSRATSGIGSYTALTDPVYTFIHGTFETPTSTTITEIEKCDVEVINKVLKNGEIGARLQTGKPTGREIKLTTSGRLVDGAFAQLLLGGASAPLATTPAASATGQLDMTNGTDYIRVNLTNIRPDTRDVNGRIHENVMEDCVFFCEGITVDEVNE